MFPPKQRIRMSAADKEMAEDEEQHSFGNKQSNKSSHKVLTVVDEERELEGDDKNFDKTFE